MKPCFVFLMMFMWYSANAAFTQPPGATTATIQIPGGVKNVDSSTNFVSIAMWVYLTTPLINNVHDLICKGRSNNANKVFFHVRWRTNYFQFRYASPDGTFHDWQTDSTYPTNTLYHIGVSYTYGTASSVKFYVNGDLTTGTWVNGTGAANGLTNDQSLTTAGVAISDSPMNGTIDDVAVWYAILSDREMKNLASRVKRIPNQFHADTIIMYYALDDWAQFSNPGLPANHEYFKDSGYQRQAPALKNSATPSCKVGFERWISYPPNE